MRNVIAAGIMLLLVVSPALATPVINVGNVILVPDQPDQQFQIMVSGEATDFVHGMDLYIQVADGGPEAVGMGLATVGIDGPAITGVDLVTGTIFANNYDTDPEGTFVVNVTPQLVESGIITAVGSEDPVVADGLLATVTIDTSGFGESLQAWDLKLTDVGGGFISTALVNGTGDGTSIADITDGQIVMAAPGDVNLDGQVNLFDIFAIKSSPRGFGTGATDATWADGDIVGAAPGTPRDGEVTLMDIFAIKLANKFGAGPYAATDGGDVSTAAVPEPSTIVLLASGLLGLLTMAIRRRRAA